MFIIFGMRTTIRILTTLRFVCGYCNQHAAQHVAVRVKKFTLFFIPLFPVSKAYFTQCVACGRSTAITRAEADQYAAWTGVGELPVPPGGGRPMTEDSAAQMDAMLNRTFGPADDAASPDKV